jgi:hypothetical protein
LRLKPDQLVPVFCHDGTFTDLQACQLAPVPGRIQTLGGPQAAYVAASVGHESVTTTLQRYAKPEAVARAQVLASGTG